MELWFLRHARTLANDLRSMERVLNEKLSPLGIRQSLQTGKRLARERFDEIYVSDTSRTKETIANMAHTHPDILKHPIIVTPMIRERDFGSDRNLTSKALNLEISVSDPDSNKLDSEETFEEVYRRAENFLNYLTYRHLFFPGHLQETNAIEGVLSEYFESELEMKSKNHIAKKNLDEYSVNEMKIIREYFQREKSREKIWILNSDSKDSMLKNDLKAQSNKQTPVKKILILTHSGFINQIYGICANQQKAQPPLIFNCSISIVSVCCSKTMRICNGSCVNEPKGMASCIKYNLERQNDITHTEF